MASESRQKLKGCCESQFSCWFGRSSLQCICIPPSRESTVTRVLYVIIFIIGACLSSAMVSRTVTEELLPKLDGLNRFCGQIGVGDCSQLYGYTAVYAICFAMASFYLILMLLTAGVTNSTSLRAGIHNGMWFFKLLLLIALVIGYFFVPVSDTVLIVALYIGFSGAAIFILIQLWLLVDLASQWNQKWSERIDNNGWWYCAMVFIVLFFYGVAAGITFLIVTFFQITGKECFHNSVYTSCSVFMCLLLSFFSILPCFPQGYAKGGFIQASIASAYIMFLTASALLIQPSVRVDSIRTDTLVAPPEITDTTTTTQAMITMMTTSNTSDEIYIDCRPKEFASKPLFNDVTLSDLVNGAVSAVILLVTVIYVCIGTFKKVVRRKSLASLVPEDEEEKSSSCVCCRKKKKDQISVEEREQRRRMRKRSWGLIQNEKHEAVYNYAVFHLIFALASFFIMMTLTNWYRPDEASLEDLNRTYPPFTVRLASAWVCGILYMVKLIYLMCCAPNRPNATKINRRARAMSGDSDVFFSNDTAGPSNISGGLDNPIPMDYQGPDARPNSYPGNPYPPGQHYPTDTRHSYPAAQSPNQGYPSAQNPRQSYPSAQNPNQGYPSAQSPRESYPSAQSPRESYPSAQNPNQGYPSAQSPRESYPSAQNPNQGYPSAQSPRESYPSAQSPNQGYPTAQSPRPNYPSAQRYPPNQMDPRGPSFSSYQPTSGDPSSAPMSYHATHNPAFYY